VKVLLLSDVHANLVALEAVLKDAGEVDAVWNLGDTVGYGLRFNSGWITART
jgi:predicted phosphodiesterase